MFFLVGTKKSWFVSEANALGLMYGRLVPHDRNEYFDMCRIYTFENEHGSQKLMVSRCVSLFEESFFRFQPLVFGF